MNKFDKIRKIYLHYGSRHQLKKLSEEIFELFEAMANYNSSRSTQNLTAIAEEIADCNVVIMQFMTQFGFEKFEGMSQMVSARMDSMRKIGFDKYSAHMLYRYFVDFAVQQLAEINGDESGWLEFTLIGYAATIGLIQNELQIDSDVIFSVMDKKIDRQLERMKKGE